MSNFIHSKTQVPCGFFAKAACCSHSSGRKASNRRTSRSGIADVQPEVLQQLQRRHAKHDHTWSQTSWIMIVPQLSHVEISWPSFKEKLSRCSLCPAKQLAGRLPIHVPQSLLYSGLSSDSWLAGLKAVEPGSSAGGLFGFEEFFLRLGCYALETPVTCFEELLLCLPYIWLTSYKVCLTFFKSIVHWNGFKGLQSRSKWSIDSEKKRENTNEA